MMALRLFILHRAIPVTSGVIPCFAWAQVSRASLEFRRKDSGPESPELNPESFNPLPLLFYCIPCKCPVKFPGIRQAGYRCLPEYCVRSH